jgi:hypothetical protein
MARFVVKKLPAGWLFVPSQRQVRALVADLGADVRRVELFGTAPGRAADRLTLGFIESRVADAGWRFYLRLWGVPEAVAGPVRGQLAAAVLAEAGRFIRGRAGRPPGQLALAFRLAGGGVESACVVRPTGGRSFPTPAGWARE